MKKFISLIVVAIAVLGSVTTIAQNTFFHAKTDKNGFYKVLDCSTTPSYFKATSEQNEDGSYNVKIYHGRQLAQTIKCDVTGKELYFLDANFDGNLDIVVGPATARNYSTILLWSDKKNEFVPTGLLCRRHKTTTLCVNTAEKQPQLMLKPELRLMLQETLSNGK